MTTSEQVQELKDRIYALIPVAQPHERAELWQARDALDDWLKRHAKHQDVAA